jgi:RNA polymerase sigma factor (sigma-70 family)
VLPVADQRHTTQGDDAAIIARSVGDPEQFGAIFDRHAPQIHRYLARRLGADAADDLVGETFVAAFRVRAKFGRGHSDARPWLYGIAANVISQNRREDVRRLRLNSVARPESHERGHADDVAARVSAQALGARLGRALSELSVADREVLLLIAWEDLTYEEVAIALAIPIGTVRSRLHRARSRVREAFGDTNPLSLTEVNLEELFSNG